VESNVLDLNGTWTETATAQTGSGRWTFRTAALFISPGGEFSAVRANGKRVTSDITADVGLRFEAEYRIGSRTGFSFSYIGGSQHDFVIHQDFPDGTDFESSDSFAYDSLTAGFTIHRRHRLPVDLFVEPFLTWATYDDIALASAGPPFDRDAPFLEVDVADAFGVGTVVGVDAPLGSSRWSFHALAGLVVIPFQGEFPTQQDEPGEAATSTLGPGFSFPVVGVGLSFGRQPRRSSGSEK